MMSAVLVAGCGDDAGSTGGSTTDSSTGGDSSGSNNATTASSTAGSSGATQSATTEVAESGSSSTGEDVPLEPIPWVSDCLVGGSNLAVLNPDLECAAVEVPLRWSDPRGDTIVVALSRVRTTVEPRRGQFWMLDGGPGSSGLGFLSPDSAAPILAAGFDLIVPSHRGTVSPLLECVGGSSEPSCRGELEAIWGDGLLGFNTEDAAHDLGHVIARTEAELDEPTIVYGVSYGTLWAEHYVGLYPEQAEGVVFDSVLSTSSDVTQQEVFADALTRGLVDRCFDDRACAAQMRLESTEALATAVVAAFDQQDCGQGDASGWLQSSARSQLGVLSNNARARNFVPLLLAMLAECDPDLTAAVGDAFFPLLSGVGIANPPTAPDLPLARWGGGVDPSLFYSDVLFGLVLGTTIVADGAEPLVAVDSGLSTLGFGPSLSERNVVWGDLPNIAPELATPQTPVLVLGSAFDLQTPPLWAEDLAAAYGVEPIIVDDGAHGLFFSPGGFLLDGSPCLRDVVLEFALDPRDDFDTACVAELPAIDPSLSRPDLQDLAQAAFGTMDPWSLLPPPA